MPRNLAHAILAVASVMATLPCYMTIYILLERKTGDTIALIIAAFVSMAYFIPTWIYTWRAQVELDYWRKKLTGFSVLWCTLAAAGVATLLMAANRYGDEIAIVVGSMGWLPAWMASTVLIWRESPFEQAERLKQSAAGRVQCIACRYDMTGLREARCPECGTQYTLDQLLGVGLEARNSYAN